MNSKVSELLEYTEKLAENKSNARLLNRTQRNMNFNMKNLQQQSRKKNANKIYFPYQFSFCNELYQL